MKLNVEEKEMKLFFPSVLSLRDCCEGFLDENKKEKRSLKIFFSRNLSLYSHPLEGDEVDGGEQ